MTGIPSQRCCRASTPGFRAGLCGEAYRMFFSMELSGMDATQSISVLSYDQVRVSGVACN